MNDTIALPRLAESVASLASCRYDESEKFIKAFFSHLEDALAVSDEVTIDGLGTFSRSSDRDNPVIFRPSAAITEALNQPFAMFEPVAIGDADLKYTDAISNSGQISDDSPATPAEEVTEEKIEEAPVVETIAPAAVPDETPEPTTTPAVPESVESEPESITEQTLPEESGRSLTAIWITVAFIIGLIIGAAMGYFGHTKIDGLIETTDSQPVHEEILPTDSLMQDNVSVIESFEADSITEPVDTIAPAVTEEITERQAVYDTVTPERFLTTMARQYYGKMEYWVFIYEANADALGNPNRIKPGTRVIIPDKSEFAAEETPEQTLSRAKQKGREIYSRFE